VSSKQWLERQLNDPYVAAAKREGYRSRAAYKLAEIADKYGLLKPGDVVVDLGAAPGGWSQVAAKRVQAAEGRGVVVALDILAFDHLPGVTILQQDFSEPAADEKLIEALGGQRASIVLSDMAAPTTGHRPTCRRSSGIRDPRAEAGREFHGQGVPGRERKSPPRHHEA
jgi:23S rRNA (uridine2552-2'-O)-methyltransferase